MAITPTPTPQDLITITHWISIAQALATAFVGIVAVVITYRMQSKQIDIAKGVKAIAHRQYETASAKLRLDLFEKRFDAYQKIVDCMEETFHYSGNFDFQELMDMDDKFEKSCHIVQFLFNNQLYEYLTDDVKRLNDRFIDTLQHAQEAAEPDDEEASERTRQLLVWEYFEARDKFNRMAREFLTIEKEKSLIA